MTVRLLLTYRDAVSPIRLKTIAAHAAVAHAGRAHAGVAGGTRAHAGVAGGTRATGAVPGGRARIEGVLDQGADHASKSAQTLV